ncbi:TATA-binding protein-associated factor Mot1 [Malassezia pachydermatis]|uniref:Snf2 chromatin remodeling protein n=1 Tax=Malassezia pachydermatis TaxID=77020 RepID=A0A0M8MSX2_9BASI|nr:snf2 chromatin remodeling protein [Malassezia pachydermatis]KOS13694.1 snf2 chromatin remodeling protein [Malassezia pachydermatis]
MGSPATRLDRLVSLLDIGSSSAIRMTAATQLGQMAALRVRGASTAHDNASSSVDADTINASYRGVDGEWNEVLTLLARVVPLLVSKSWDTRNAAAQALYHICQAAGVWDPDTPANDSTSAEAKATDVPEIVKKEEDEEVALAHDVARASQDLGFPPSEHLKLADFSLAQVLAKGTKLLASAGREYDVPELLSQERLKHAKKDVLGKLGLGFGGADMDLGLDVEAELSIKQSKSETASAVLSPAPAAEPDPEPEPVSDKPLSARERAQLKRKRKLEAKGQARPAARAEPEKRAKLDHSAPTSKIAAVQSLQGKRGEWPFRALAEFLSVELFSPTWEVRHGAALGLRELFRTQGSGGGKTLGASSTANQEAHAAWCEDLAVRLLCVFALDRLGDFVFDHVVAPVRETASQTLAQLLPHMSSELVRATHHVLLEMVRQDSVRAVQLVGKDGQKPYVWEVRHAGLLGIKYEVAMRVDVLGVEDEMLADVLDVAQLGLRDDDDDVRAVAAAMLLPITRNIVAHQLERVPALIDQLWACVSDKRDDLASSAASVMDLLAALIAHDDVLQVVDRAALSQRVPSLFRFVRHTITNVRLAMLHAMRALLQAPSLPRDWLDDALVRLLFQNMLVEEKPAIRDATAQVWAQVLDVLGPQLAECVAPHVPALFQLVLTPIGTPMNMALFYVPPRAQSEHNIDRGILAQDLTLVSMDVVLRGRIGAASALGEVLAHAPMAEADACRLLTEALTSTSALQKCLASVVAQRWAERVEDPVSYLDTHASFREVHTTLLHLLDASMPGMYAEMHILLQRLHHECQQLITSLVRDAHVERARVPPLVEPMTLEAARAIADAASLAPGVSTVQEQKNKIALGIDRYEATKETNDVLVLAAVAGAVVAWSVLPPKLNPVIRSLMNSIKYEEQVDLQARAALAVARLIALCTAPTATANPSPKIVKNLCAFVCQDTSFTSLFADTHTKRDGIMLLAAQESALPRRSAANVPDDTMTPGQFIRRGAECALRHVCTEFSVHVWERVPMLWTCSAQPLLDLFATTSSLDETQGQAVLDACSVLECVAPHLAPEIRTRLTPLLDALVRVIQSEYAVIRNAGARCFSMLTRTVTDEAMHKLVECIVPMLGEADLARRQGAMEVISCTVRGQDERLLPYVLFLVVPVLGRMSDSDEAVRLLATNTFAELVKLVPLIHGLPDPPHFSPALLARRETERAFLAQLMDGSKVQPYQLPVEMKVQLRPYQLDGVSWMAFLARYQLHGILCDDMGLGKTLQSITLLSCRHFERQQRWAATSSPDARPIPSLIVCPPTLTGHWVHEIQQYSPNLKPLLYAGHPSERARLQSQIEHADAVVMSYDVVRNDIHMLAQRTWFYCILDEGHVICSAKTKTTRAVKQIRAQHRLILSGTPIQNNVLELWSLFDFLMPGFLGSDQSFHERFAKPVLACRNGKPSASDKEAATLALEALHKQIVPFLLRRLKEDVLNDLPPKIIQDVECELSDIQKQLYDDFIKKQHNDDDHDEEKEDVASGAQQHIFQTLQYLRKLANHPSLVLDPSIPAQKQLLTQVNAHRGTLAGLAHAPKLQALRQLLLDCGIGLDTPANDAALMGADTAASVSQHRVLVFCQMKQMLDVIERDLFQALMPNVTYLRLDGSVSSDRRHGIVQAFNADPSIDVLLLTTSVGGLGLTLTGADTVIFVEHDWNPMKDLQAMDRAHRLGQKKVVNVYRLITRNTLEAKIMGLQQFKLNVANSVVTQQNKSMEQMDTDRILDLFGPSSEATAAPSKEAALPKIKGISQKALLASLENMPDIEEDEYASMTNWRPSTS